MKEEKKVELIESAIRLFAEKGFHLTSVQDIVDDCGISKGAFYHYFPSKEALHLEIFKYYFNLIRRRIDEVEQEDLEIREKLKKQMHVPFEQIRKNKAFFVMYLREQSFSIDQELREYLNQAFQDMLGWYEDILFIMYGKKIKPYIGDIVLLMDGLRNSFLTAALFLDESFDTWRIPDFLLNRVDDVIRAYEAGEKPILSEQDMKNLKACFPAAGGMDPKEKIAALFVDMQEQLESMEMEEEQKQGLLGVVEFLKSELDKEPYNKYIIQGMLANFKEVQVFDIYREKISALLNIQML